MIAQGQLPDQRGWLSIRRQAPGGGTPISGPDSSTHVQCHIIIPRVPMTTRLLTYCTSNITIKVQTIIPSDIQPQTLICYTCIPSPVGSIVWTLSIHICMDIISKSDQTFSNETSSCIAAPIRSSTSAICDSKWPIFSSWCNQRRINPLTVNVQQIAKFLFENQKGLAPSILVS